MAYNHYYHHDHQRLILTPSSSPDCIVFPFDQRTRKFQTNSYTSFQTQNRISEYEIEQILTEVAAPVKEWYEKHKTIFEGSPGFWCIYIICMLLLPLMFVFICWLHAAQGKARYEMKSVAERARAIMIEKNPVFRNAGLMWNAPKHFPQWIELRRLSGFNQQQYDGFVQPGIGMTMMPQSPSGGYGNKIVPTQPGYYSSVPQNQYHANMYSAKA